MSGESEKIYIPPYAGVRLIECKDHFQLVPVPAMRILYGYGKIKASQATFETEDGNIEPLWSNLGPDEDVWAIVQWAEFEDGTKVQGNISYLHPECSEEEARKSMDRMSRLNEGNREDMLALADCLSGDAHEEAKAYIEDNYPNYQSEPDPNASDEYDVYHARLKVMGELHPKTVELIKIANATKDPAARQVVERKAVQSFFAEMAHYFTEEQVLAWQRSNPVGTEWMCEFGETMRNPRRTIDPVNHELALNWLRRRYNELSARELSVSIFQRILQWLTPGAIKKRRERLGLTTKRSTGPRPKSEGQ